MGKRLRAGVVMGLVTLLLGGCSGGDEPETCAAYACLNGTYWRPTFEIAPSVEVVDVRYCESSVCREISLEVPATALSCKGAEPASVCVGLRGTQLEIEARWIYGEKEHEPKNGMSYQLVVSDHATGDVLFDEQRSAKFEVTSEDSCHRCWQAELD
jgi:hypothetical protein